MGVSLPGGGGKRGLDFDINLVPFIDLLSCLISFLLVTAVWTNLARIDVNQPMPNPNDQEQPEELPPPEARVLIDKEGYLVHLPPEPMPRRIALDADGATYKRWELAEGLKKMKEANPDKPPKVLFAAVDESKFKEYIGVLDTCLGLGLTDMKPMNAADLAGKLTALMTAPGAPPPAP